MKFLKIPLGNAYVIEPEPFVDNRGWFYRLFCQNELKEIGFYKNIVQINHSFTQKKGSIRGMHFQFHPMAEIKIVKCLVGSVFDVIIDLRKNSPTYLKWHSEKISSKNKRLIYVPEGFAHGFQTLENSCEILYLHSESYSSEYESGLRYNDPKLDITWPLELTEISQRDSQHKLIDKFFKGFDF